MNSLGKYQLELEWSGSSSFSFEAMAMDSSPPCWSERAIAFEPFTGWERRGRETLTLIQAGRLRALGLLNLNRKKKKEGCPFSCSPINVCLETPNVSWANFWPWKTLIYVYISFFLLALYHFYLVRNIRPDITLSAPHHSPYLLSPINICSSP